MALGDDWERVELKANETPVYRLWVPDGWLVQVGHPASGGVAVTYVPDFLHRWEEN